MSRAVPGPRPRLRGVSHRVAFFVALAAGVILVASARDGRAAAMTAIYSVLLAGMFGVSATLHRADWSPRAFGWLRRADHAMIFVFAACGGAPPMPAPPAPQPPAITSAPPLVFRQVHVGSSQTTRTTFELALAGDRATLVETEERAPDAASWTRVARRTYRGTRRDAELELRTDDMQPLALQCRSLGVSVAPASAVVGDCSGDHDAVRVDALVCGAAGQTDADADADDRLVFAPPPGVEWVEAACGANLRQSR